MAIIGSDKPPRRLAREARRDQLVEVAMPIVAEQGLTEFSLDDVAARADVTRNLLYHYFPRGRPDLVLAVAERAGHELTDGWITDEDVPIEQRVAENNARIVAHALQPSDAWRINRLARSTPTPELREIVDRFVERVVSNMSMNHLGTPDPPPFARLALSGYFAFAETVLDEVRDGEFDPEQVVQMLNETLEGTLRAAASTTAA
jgi:AcrR family transcriptional regulator